MVTGAVLLGLWLLLVDTLDLAEVMAGVAVASAATAVGVAAGGSDLGGVVRCPDPRRVVALPAAALRDTGMVLTATVLHGLRVRPLRSGFHTRPASIGSAEKHDPKRRALSALAMSFAPGTYVLSRDAEQDSVVVHSLPLRNR
jgi:multisubunit Na+/H+ antiporter MnhE subunit